MTAGTSGPGRRKVLGMMLAGLAVPAVAAAPPAQAQRRVGVASYNLYLGADLQPLFTASNQLELVQRAAQIYGGMEATNFPERAGAVADLISARNPDLVGLQEVALWERGPQNGALTVTYDFLGLLLAELAARGTPYRAVASNTNFTGQLPISMTDQARFTDHDVIIVRDDLPVSRLRVASPQSYNFAVKLDIPTSIPGVAFTVPRGYSTVDVTVRGKTFRFANGHLEAFGPAAVRNAQAQELAAALAASPHPVVLVGDMNSRPTDTSGAYGALRASGLSDAWLETGGDPNGGWTSGQTDTLLDPNRIDHRIDYVLGRGVDYVSVEVIGDEEADRSQPTGFWPADHAGVSAVVALRP